jgi:GNAT superfamily N-acetyltransferase
MKIRRFIDADTAACHALYAACHPTWPDKPLDFWWAHPTLVLEVEGAVCGSTSFSVGIMPVQEVAHLLPQGEEMGWGHGVYVDPTRHGQGYGWVLAQARHETLRALGVTVFVGLTQPNNHAMRAIFARQGLTHTHTVPDSYPGHIPGLFYAGAIR